MDNNGEPNNGHSLTLARGGTWGSWNARRGVKRRRLLVPVPLEHKLNSRMGMMDGNVGCLLYAMRTASDGIPLGGTVYYGHISGMGELVHESELEPIATEAA